MSLKRYDLHPLAFSMFGEFPGGKLVFYEDVIAAYGGTPEQASKVIGAARYIDCGQDIPCSMCNESACKEGEKKLHKALSELTGK
jgi:hypothetical protein